jgi:transcriptional regulator with XRE-family HTH domain
MEFRLKELRKKRKISQLKLAIDLNMNQNNISRYENGEREADYKTLVLFADYFNVSLDYLLGRTVAKNVINTAAESIFDEKHSDSDPTPQTLIKASMAITHSMRNGDKDHGVNVDLLFAVELYKLILIQANAGNLPKNWAGRSYKDGKICCSKAFLDVLNAIGDGAIKPQPNPHPDADAPIPDVVDVSE